MQSDTVYKIVSAEEWKSACENGKYSGSADDKRDGFIHLSTRTQISGTLEKHFFQQTGLLLIRFRSADLAANLRWEPSRGGALFPHFYGCLSTDLATHEDQIRLDAQGHHHLPELAE